MKLWDIGPEGELYKCWNDVGKADRLYGYLDWRIICWIIVELNNRNYE